MDFVVKDNAIVLVWNNKGKLFSKALILEKNTHDRYLEMFLSGLLRTIDKEKGINKNTIPRVKISRNRILTTAGIIKKYKEENERR